MTVVTNLGDLSQKMRAALVDRHWVHPSTAAALERRGLARVIEEWRGKRVIELTGGGERAREAILAPLTPGTRVRHASNGLVGGVVRVERGDSVDVVVLLWDGEGREETCGSPAYLETVEDDGDELARATEEAAVVLGDSGEEHGPPTLAQARRAMAQSAAVEAYEPFWVRQLVETVGRELHYMDMLASQDRGDTGYARGQRDTFADAAKWLAGAVAQAADRLGLADVLEASRAGATVAEVAAVPQRLTEEG